MRHVAKGPLRRIVREFTTEEPNLAGGISYGVRTRHWEELECGHIMRPRRDIFGEYDAVRRRCKQCYAEAEASRLPDAVSPDEPDATGL